MFRGRGKCSKMMDRIFESNTELNISLCLAGLLDGGLGRFSRNIENFATASRRYTGDIRNSSVVGLFMTPVGQRKRLGRVMAECTCLLHIGPL